MEGSPLLQIGLKVAPESISEGLFFKVFLGGACPRPLPRSLHAQHALHAGHILHSITR